MTTVRLHRWFTSARSCEMNIIVRPCVSRSLLNTLMICACRETSSDETGSSATMNSGSIAMARAIPTL